MDALSLHPQIYSFKKEGERRLNPCIDNFSKDQLDYYLKRFKSSTNLQLTCLYGDILLDYKGPIKIEKKFAIFEALVSKLLQLGDSTNGDYSIINRVSIQSLSGALELSLLFKNDTYIKSCVGHIYNAMETLSRKEQYDGFLLSIFKMLLVLYKKGYVDEEHSKNIIKELEVATKWCFENRKFLIYHSFCNNLIEWKISINPKDASIRDLYLEQGKAYEIEADFQQGRSDKSEFVKAGFLEDALKNYTMIGESLKINELKLKIREAYKKAEQTECASFSQTISIPKERVANYSKIYEDCDDLDTGLRIIGNDPLLKIDVKKLKEETSAELKKNSLLLFMPASGIYDGRKVAQTTTPEENTQVYFEQSFILNLSIRMNIYLKNFFSILNDKGMTVNNFINLYKKWDFYNADREIILKEGFQSFLDGKYISALHILVPQFEGCLRDMLQSIGIATISIKSNETQQEKSLGELVLRSDIRKVLGEDFAQYIYITMASQNGWNLRNNIAHGLVSVGDCDEIHTLAVFHMFMRLLNFKIKNDCYVEDNKR